MGAGGRRLGARGQEQQVHPEGGRRRDAARLRQRRRDAQDGRGRREAERVQNAEGELRPENAEVERRRRDAALRRELTRFMLLRTNVPYTIRRLLHVENLQHTRGITTKKYYALNEFPVEQRNQPVFYSLLIIVGPSLRFLFVCQTLSIVVTDFQPSPRIE